MPQEDDQPQAGETLGRIVGESVLDLRFRCRLDQDVYVGDILVADDEETGNRFYLRVTNVRHGAEAASPDWTHRTAGNMMVMDDRGIPHEMHEREQRLYKLGICRALGYVKDGRFRKAKTVPPHFAPVRRADAQDYAFLSTFMGDVHVGHLRSGETVVDVPVGVPGGEAFPYHIGVFATTGMGKSNLMKVLAGSCMETGRYGLLIVDPHGEYHDGGGDPDRQGLSHHPNASRNLEVYSHRSLRTPHHNLTLSGHEVAIGDLMNLYDFSGPQRELLEAARRHYGPSWLVNLHEHDAARIQQEVPGNWFEGTVGVVKRRTHRLFASGLVHRDPKVTVTKSIVEQLRAGKTVLVDSGGLHDKEELLITTVLARAIFDANKRDYGDDAFGDIPPVLITLEEAQRVLGRGARSSHNVFAQIAREGRKFKTGLCAITQQPKLLDTEVISQFNTLFILGLADKRDRDILQDSAKQDVSQLENEIQMLMPGEALLTSPYAPFAVPLKVHLYETYLQEHAAPTSTPQSQGNGTTDDDGPHLEVEDGFY